MPTYPVKCVRRYLTTHDKKFKRIFVTQFRARMSELDEYLSYIPCQKDEESLAPQMERADKKLNKIDIYTDIIGSLSVDLATAYWATKGGRHFPLCVKALIKDLIPKEVQVNTQKAKIRKNPNQSGR